MPQALLALALFVTQLLSWSGTPVCLCIDDDGSVSIDAGGEHCACMSEARHDEHGDEDDCHAGDHPCGCTHIPVSAEQPPAVLASTPAHSAPWIVPLFAMPVNVAAATVAAVEACWRTSGPAAGHAPWHCAPSSAVLRC